MKTRHSHCLNCGQELKGDYCYICGQEDADINLNFSQFLHEFLGEFFTFDSRIARTLNQLVFKPGFLTREFYRGRRVPYVPPLRLYLFISFFLFLWLGLIDINQTTHFDEIVSVNSLQELRQSALRELKIKNTPQFIVNISDKILENLIQIAEKPGAFMDLLTSRLPYLMFMLLPVFALLLRLHFPASPFNYLQYLVFALHYHAFASLLNFLFIISDAFLNISLGWLVISITYFYTAISMRIALQSSILGCMLKPFTLLSSYMFILNFGLFIFMLLNILNFN